MNNRNAFSRLLFNQSSRQIILAVMLCFLFDRVAIAAPADPQSAGGNAVQVREVSSQALIKKLDLEAEKFHEKRFQLMDLLFPKSKEWTRFNDLPLAITEPNAGGKAKETLRQLGVDLNSINDSDDIKEYLPNFRKTTDGKIGLVYSGSVPGQEAPLTIVWPDYPRGVPPQKENGMSLKIIRLRQGENPAYTGLAEGCCDDQSEAFYRMDLVNPDGGEIIRSATFLEVPDGLIEGHFPVLFSLGGTIRFSPKIDDAPVSDGAKGELPDIGNVAQIYKSTFGATSLAGYVDREGKIWVLIRTDLPDNQPFYVDSNHYVDIGWVQASSIGLTKQNGLVLAWLDKIKKSYAH